MEPDPPHILVVDDDTRLRELLRRYLAEQGFRVTTARDSREARRKLSSFDFDLLVLDIMMPGETGLELTRWLHDANRVPILLLTAMGETEDRITGLESGADDYLTKPFEPRELVLRIDAILRRTHKPVEPASPTIEFGGFRFDLTREELCRGEERIHLTSAESALLKALAQRAGEPVSREDLSSESPMIGSARAIDVQVTRLRRKIEANPKFPRFLQAVRGVGYMLIPD
ncbi:MAG TPA: response regulator [Kiloniellales bacterium]|nr:response regulator [Kiloniellales bacterium]